MNIPAVTSRRRTWMVLVAALSLTVLPEPWPCPACLRRRLHLRILVELRRHPRPARDLPVGEPLHHAERLRPAGVAAGRRAGVPRARRVLDVQPGRARLDLQAEARRQVPRRHAAQRRGRQVQLRPDGRSGDQVPPGRGRAAGLLRPERGGRSDDGADRAQEAEGLLPDRDQPGLLRARVAEGRQGARGGVRPPAGRHRALQVRRVGAEPARQARAEPGLQPGARPTSTRGRRTSPRSRSGRFPTPAPGSPRWSPGRWTRSTCRRRTRSSVSGPIRGSR